MSCIKELIRQEIERRKKICEGIFERESDTYYQGKAVAYGELLPFIDSLPDDFPDAPKIVSEDLEEAAKEYMKKARKHLFDDSPIGRSDDAFIAGAEWQKRHDAELIEIAYNDGITIGMTKQKEQMMKEAVEGEVAPQEDTRPSASERLDLLRARIRDAVKGYDPFRVRTRNAKAVAWRQCVYLLLKNEGYTLHAIADASGYNHATIAWGIKHAKDLVDIGDSEYKRIWNAVNYIDEGWR